MQKSLQFYYPVFGIRCVCVGGGSKVTSFMLNGNDLILLLPLGISYLKEMRDYCLTRREDNPRDRWDTRRGGGVLSRQRTEKKELNRDPSAHVTKI